jgi:hypothetical protein
MSGTGTSTVAVARGAMVALTGWVPDSPPSFHFTPLTVVGLSDGLAGTTFREPAAGAVPVASGVACVGVAPEVTVSALTACPVLPPAAPVNAADASNSPLVPRLAVLGTVTLQVAVTFPSAATSVPEAGEVTPIVRSFGAFRRVESLRTACVPVLAKVAVIVVSGSTVSAAYRLNGSRTRIGVLPVTPSTVTSIVAAPGAQAVTTPQEPTVATRERGRPTAPTRPDR